MYTNGLKDRFGSPLVSQRDVNNTLGSYTLKSELTSSLEAYVLKTNLNTTLGNYALKTDLSGYATTTSLGSYVLKTELTSTLGSYVSKSTYDSFVSTTNTELGKRGSLASANTWSGTNTFSGALNKTSSTSSPTDNSILNKGENDDLYAPISVTSEIENLSGTISGVSTVITSHSNDKSIHVTAADKESLTTLVAEKDNFVNKNDDATLSKTLTVTGGATFDSTITKSTNTSSPTDTSVLNKGETDALYAPKSLSTTVSTLNSTVSGINTTLGNTAKTNTANTFTAANTFNSTATIKGAATFNSTITKSTTTSSPTNTSVLNKGENDALYAPKSLADTVDTLDVNIATVSTTIAEHETDESVHVSATDKESLASLVADKDNFVNKNNDATLSKTLTVAGDATFSSGLTKSNNTSNPTATTVLNKGESDNLYAPKSLSTTVTNLSNTVNGLGSTYVAKTTYDSFVTSTNNSISTLNTNVGNCALKTDLNSYVKSADLTTTLGGYAKTSDLSGYAKTTSANTFTAPTTFNSNMTVKGAATFNSVLSKSVATSSPSDSSILNKGENDALYAPISLADTVDTLDVNLTTVSTTIADHENDDTIHMTSSDREVLSSLASEKDNFVNKNNDATLSKTLTVSGDATFSSGLTKSNNTSSPTATTVLNKGETDALYAPKSLSTTVTNLSNTVNGLGSTYVAKTTYDSFVSSTNSSISTLNTNVGKCALKTDLNSYVKSADLTTTLGSYAKTSDLSSYVTTTSLNSTLGSYAKTGSANTFTAANTFNSTATVKGAATFDSTITKSTTTSSPTDNSVLNKGENDALYAPKSLADTVGDIKSGVTTISTIIASHEGDTSMHISSTERDGLTTLISEKDNFAKKSECDELYAPKSLSTTVTNLSNTVNGLGSTYVAKTTYDSFVSSTNSSISTLNTNVGNCALKTDLNSYAKTSDLSSYVTSTSLSTTLGSYVTTSNLNTTLGSYAKTSALSDYVKSSSLTTTLGSYVTTTALDSKLSGYVTSSSLTSTLGSYAKTSDLSAYAKTGSANTFTAANTFNSTATIKGAATFDSTITKSTTTSSPATTAVLNKGENDALYAPKSHVSDTSVHMSAADRETLTELVNAAPQFANKLESNTFTETNTFSKAVTAQNGITASGGDVLISNGILTFEDLIDGTVVERSGASGYQYIEGIPTSFNNGICYDIGEISNSTNLSVITFSAEGRLVQTCELWFTTPATVPTTHQWPKNIYWIDSATGAAPTLIASKNYRIVFRQEPNKIIASIAYLY